MTVVSDRLPSDALSQRLPSYLGFSHLGHGVSLHSCSSNTQLLLLTLDVRYLLSAATPDLGCGVSPLCHLLLLQATVSIIYRHILIDTNILYLYFIFYIFVSILYFLSINRYKYFVCSVIQWCLTLSDHMDCSLPGSSVHGISQARILEWVAISFSRGSSRPRIEPTSFVSPALATRFFTTKATLEAQLKLSLYIKKEDPAILNNMNVSSF